MSYWLFEGESANTQVVSESVEDELGNPKLQFKAGEVLYAKRHIMNFQVHPYIRVWRAIIRVEDGLVAYREEMVPVVLPKGESIRTISVDLPKNIKPGHYLLQTFVTYHLNPLRDATFELLPPTKFEVIR